MPSSEPQFATVSLLISEDVAGTFRVPITEETTVRRLAKDAMQRLLTRRSDGQYTFTRENISVTEVFVNCGSHKAEVFAQDLVTHVVRVKEEVVHMRLRLKEGRPTTTTTNTTTAITTNATTTTAAAAATSTKTAKVDEISHATTAAAKHENTTNEDNEQKTGACGGKRTKTEVTTTAKDKKEQTESGRRSGASVSSHQRKQQTIEEEEEKDHDDEKKSAVATTKSKRVTATTSSSKGVTEPVTVNVTSVDKKSNTNSTTGGIAEVQKTSGSRLGWGPEAEKYFPDNYVASPNKLMSRAQPKKTTTTTAAAATTTKTAKVDEISHATTATAKHENTTNEDNEQKKGACGGKRTKTEVTTTAKDKKEQTESGRRSGASVSSHQRKQQTIEEEEEKDHDDEKKSAVATTKSKRVTATTSSSKGVTEPVTVNVTSVDKKSNTNSTTGGIAEVQKTSGSRLGWGPEAEKYFPDNYVASPNKLMSRAQPKKTTTTSATTTTTTTTAANKKKTTSSSKVAEEDAEIQPPQKNELPAEEVVVPAVEGPRRLGWGPEAEKYFPDNYVASPDRIPRLIREAKKREKQLQEEAQRKAQEGNKDKMVVEVEEEEEEVKKQIDTNAGSSISRILYSLEDKQNAELHSGDCTSRRSGTVVMRENEEEEEEPRTAPAVLATAEITPQTTGSSKSRQGKTSTVSRKRRLSEMADGTTASQPVVVERKLMYDVADDAAVNRTPVAQSTRRLIEENEEKVEDKPRPPGWGKEALRYFDAETYFDDPSKAKLSPEILARPVRARREVVLPYYFTAITK